jgi:hypothetical protein
MDIEDEEDMGEDARGKRGGKLKKKKKRGQDIDEETA